MRCFSDEALECSAWESEMASNIKEQRAPIQGISFK
jgi:hypothetical protein